MLKVGTESQKSQMSLSQDLLKSPQISPQNQTLNEISSNTRSSQIGVYDQLNQLFSEENKQQKSVQEARDILGESAQLLSDEQVYDLINEVQFLVDTWLEEFERNVFEGKTLKEITQPNI